jgi:hypothetical protein
MQRLLDLALFGFYLTGIVVMVWVGNAITSNLMRLNRDLDRNALVHDQLLKEHLRQWQEHERLLLR